MRSIITKALGRDLLLAELSGVLSRLQSIGEVECAVLFGFAWGLEYYPTERWVEETISLNEIEGKVSEVEKTGIGKLGSDNLVLRVPNRGIEFRFCDEADIHLEFQHPSSVTEAFYVDWRNKGFGPTEWEKNAKVGPGQRIR